MLKTNATQAREAIREYVIEHAGYNDDEGRDYTLQEIYQDFMRWYGISKNHSRNYQEAFADYCQIIPGTVAFPIYSEAIQNIVKFWLKQTKEEASKYSYDQSEKLFYNLIYRELCYLLEKEKA